MFARLFYVSRLNIHTTKKKEQIERYKLIELYKAIEITLTNLNCEDHS